jgi:four helix bundle protein
MTQFVELQDRLVNFAVSIVSVTDMLPNTQAGHYIGGKILCCSISAARRYNEHNSNRQGFIAKLRGCLEELQNIYIHLQVVTETGLIPADKITDVMDECNHLIAIFIKSIVTTEKNNK